MELQPLIEKIDSFSQRNIFVSLLSNLTPGQEYIISFTDLEKN
jgi:hypothetical protein